MTSHPKGFSIWATSKKIPWTKQKARRTNQKSQDPPIPSPSLPQQVVDTEITNIPDTEGAPSKRQKNIPADQSMVHVFLGAASVPYLSEEELKKRSFRIEEQTN